ncbi:hypothetical protein ONS95_010646 [Cadophora gregata]|uniref:uncharacterized protein n=1 Tax=Cadophora gregata TaxID=51156 RepID=UPI0026DBDA07|nr:uncharacterized protein ONS95_010646 [Cadophora gregata]KAK0122407.1 hypothetical protein ONS95_010646 [Cadophora gregata]KAK0127886.1 hypothetical protein ONS96_007386 [Cadophora gregata f. sp. sojae]
MDSSSLTSGNSDAEKSKVPDREHVREWKGFGELIRLNPTMVTIYVGPAKAKWVLHEAILCNESSFFKSAFQNGFAESSSKTMHLEEDDPKVFTLFVNFLYSPQAGCNQPHDGSPEACDHIRAYYELEAFADRIGWGSLSAWAEDKYNYCMTTWTGERYRPQPESVRFVFERCPEFSPFRKYMVADAVYDYLSWEFEDFGYWAKLMGINAKFAEQCNIELKEHMKSSGNLTYFEGDCTRRDCTVHCREEILAEQGEY